MLLPQGWISGEGTQARIVRSAQVCNSFVYFIDYVLLPETSLADLPPFELYDPEAEAREAEAARAAACSRNATVLQAIQNNANLTTLYK